MTDILKQIHASRGYAKGAHDNRVAHFKNVAAKLDDDLLNNGPFASMVTMEKNIRDITGIAECQQAWTLHLMRLAMTDIAAQSHIFDEYTVIANCCTTDNFTPNDLNDSQKLLH